MSTMNDQLTIRLEIHLAPRTENLQTSKSLQSSASSIFSTKSSTNSLGLSPRQLAIDLKKKDDINDTRSQSVLKETDEYMKYLQNKYNLSTTQPQRILGRSIKKKKKYEDDDVKKPHM